MTIVHTTQVLSSSITFKNIKEGEWFIQDGIGHIKLMDSIEYGGGARFNAYQPTQKAYVYLTDGEVVIPIKSVEIFYKT